MAYDRSSAAIVRTDRGRLRDLADTLLKLPAILREGQDTFHRTGGLHACALFDLQGNLETLRRTLGRHNALDKLSPCFARNRLPAGNRVLLLSGRASFEMNAKALAAGIPIVAAISAPTSFASIRGGRTTNARRLPARRNDERTPRRARPVLAAKNVGGP